MKPVKQFLQCLDKIDKDPKHAANLKRFRKMVTESPNLSHQELISKIKSFILHYNMQQLVAEAKGVSLLLSAYQKQNPNNNPWEDLIVNSCYTVETAKALVKLTSMISKYPTLGYIAIFENDEEMEE